MSGKKKIIGKSRLPDELVGFGPFISPRINSHRGGEHHSPRGDASDRSLFFNCLVFPLWTSLATEERAPAAALTERGGTAVHGQARQRVRVPGGR